MWLKCIENWSSLIVLIALNTNMQTNLNLDFRFKRYNIFKFGDKMKKYRRWGMGGMQLCQKLACIDPCAAIKG